MNRIRYYFIKFLVLVIIFLLLIISFKKSSKFKSFFVTNILDNNISFYTLKKSYTKLFGSILPFDTFEDSTLVFNEKIQYKSISENDDFIVLEVDTNYMVPSITSGIVTFIGSNEKCQNCIIIDGDEINIIYSNINSSVKLYDEIKKGEYIGEVIDNNLYLNFEKDNEKIDYKKYI